MSTGEVLVNSVEQEEMYNVIVLCRWEKPWVKYIGERR